MRKLKSKTSKKTLNKIRALRDAAQAAEALLPYVTPKPESYLQYVHFAGRLKDALREIKNGNR